MKTIRKFAYASLLALGSLTFMSGAALAQDAHGSFTLTHDVRWQNAAVPAGDYKFSVESRGPSEMLVLSKVTGERLGFMILVNDADASGPYSGVDTAVAGKLTVLAKAGSRYVSSMELPTVGLTLHFTTPADTREVALATVPASPSK